MFKQTHDFLLENNIQPGDKFTPQNKHSMVTKLGLWRLLYM